MYGIASLRPGGMLDFQDAICDSSELRASSDARSFQSRDPREALIKYFHRRCLSIRPIDSRGFTTDATQLFGFHSERDNPTAN